MKKAKVEKLVFGGQALGRNEETGKIVFLWNALAGEEVEYEILKKKANFIEGVAVNILKKSPARISPQEKHFLSCSPWQIMTVVEENYWKQKIAEESYFKIKNLPEKIEIVTEDGEEAYHYRNKIEFSFSEEDQKMSLAFFGRGSKRRVSLSGCDLAEKGINETALTILAWVNQEKIPIRSLKSLIVRSNHEGQSIAALFIKDELRFKVYPSLNRGKGILRPFNYAQGKLDVATATEALRMTEKSQGKFPLPDCCSGFQLYYSTHKCPAAVPTKLLYSQGDDFLLTKLKGTSLKFGLLSFFQVNIGLFEKALEDIEQFLDADKEVIDFYAGVGAISLPLAQKCGELTLVDNNEEAILYAEENIVANKIKGAKAVQKEAEKMLELINKNQIIIFDPPRAGLHQKIIDTILVKRPERLIYLSCNLTTQARDICLLQDQYDLKFCKLYNFFPRTPHIEGLIVLERK